MIHRDEIRHGVETVRGNQVAWVSLRFEGEAPIREGMDAQQEIEQMRSALMDKIYGDANKAVSEMEFAVMSSLRLDANSDQIAAMFRKLRETISVG